MTLRNRYLLFRQNGSKASRIVRPCADTENFPRRGIWEIVQFGLILGLKWLRLRPILSNYVSLRKLYGQQLNNQVCLNISDTICLAFFLVKRIINKIYRRFRGFFPIILYRALFFFFLKKINTVYKKGHDHRALLIRQ